MCLGNRADVSSHYINRQLCALWENAEVCTRKHGTGLRPTHAEVEYGTCLYEFFGPGKHPRKGGSKSDLSFYALFGIPQLQFVCNHEVILFLTIKDGHYNLDTSKSPTKNTKYRERINNYTLAYRLAFDIAGIENFPFKAVGDSDNHTLDLFILNTATALYCPEFSSITDLDVHNPKLAALDHYITAYYLPLVKRAGHHVLHSLPSFDCLNSTTPRIDYSLISTCIAAPELHGIPVDEVNAYLRGLWLEAAVWVDEHGIDSQHVGTRHKGCLAEHKSQPIDEVQLYMYFGPLEVRALCQREVVVYVDIPDAHFYLDGNTFDQEPHHKLPNWKLALIMDVDLDQDNTGNVRRLNLDIPSARYCQTLSTMATHTKVDSDLLDTLRATVVRYITTHYLQILQESGNQQIYYQDKRIHVSTSTENSLIEREVEDDCYCVGPCFCAAAKSGPVSNKWERSQWGSSIDPAPIGIDTTTAEYDVIAAVTQGAVNLHFRSLWEVARRRTGEIFPKVPLGGNQVHDTCLARYVYSTGSGGDHTIFFEATFDAPQLQLLPSHATSNDAVLYLHLLDGKMKALDCANTFVKNAEDIPFGDWRIAFEVPLKLEDCSDQRPASASLLKRLNRTAHSTFKQLILDIPHAKFSLSRSTLPGLLDCKNLSIVREKYNSLTHYLINFYLPAFVNAGNDVLYTIPMSDGTLDSVSPVTSISFQTVPFTFGPARKWTEGLFGPQRGIFNRNQIVFTGMTGGQPLPTGLAASLRSWNFSGGKDGSENGAIVLSRKVFLESKILSFFDQINRETTVLPAFCVVQTDGERLLELTTWDKHPDKRDMACAWNQVPGSDDKLTFEWYNRDESRYGEGKDTIHSVISTRNTLSVPIVGLHGEEVKIIIQGHVELKLAHSTEDDTSEIAMQAKWISAINLVSNIYQGLTIHTSPSSIVPEFHAEHDNGHSTFADALQGLKRQFSKELEFGHLVNELKTSLVGAQSQFYVRGTEHILVNPTFNRNGDLVVELQPSTGDTTGIVGQRRNWALHAANKLRVGGAHLSGGPVILSKSSTVSLRSASANKPPYKAYEAFNATLDFSPTAGTTYDIYVSDSDDSQETVSG